MVIGSIVKICRTSLLLLTFLFFILISLPVIMDSAAIQRALSTWISTEMIQGLKPGRVRFTLFPHPSLTLSQIEMAKGPFQNCTIEHAVINLSPMPLLKREVIVRKITLKGIDLADNLDLSRAVQGLTAGGTSPTPVYQGYLGKKGFSVELINVRSPLFHQAEMFVSISPSQISGKIDIKDIKDLPLFLPEELTLQSLSARRLSGDFIFTGKDRESKKPKHDNLSAMNIPDLNNISLTGDADLTLSDPLIQYTDPAQDEKVRLTTLGIGTIQARLSMTESSIDLSNCRMSVKCYSHGSADGSAAPLISAEYTATDSTIDESGPLSNSPSLLFSGKGLNIEKNARQVSYILPDDPICQTIFDILQAGVVDDISVHFQNNKNRDHVHGKECSHLIDLFDPQSMLIQGKLSNGTVKIPGTELTATHVQGDVIVKQGVLHTTITEARMGKSTLHNGDLTVDVIHQKFPYDGEFEISADMGQLQQVLPQLIDHRAFAGELARIENLKGSIRGILKIGGREEQTPSIFVRAGDILLQGEYPRLPAEISITSGTFQYSNQGPLTPSPGINIPSPPQGDHNIALDHITGVVGQSKFSDFSALLSLNNLTNDTTLSFQSGTTHLSLGQLLPWLASLLPDAASSNISVKGSHASSSKDSHHMERMHSLLSTASVKGTLFLEKSRFYGSISHPDTWEYLFQGRCENMDIAQNIKKIRSSDKKSISHLSFNFIHSCSNRDYKSRLWEITGYCHDTTQLSSWINSKYLKDIKTPFTLFRGMLEKNRDQTSFRGNVDFNQGLQVKFSGDIDSKSHVLFPELQLNIVQNGVTTAQLSSSPWLPFSLTGAIDTDNVKQLLKPDSFSFKTLTKITGGKKFTIESAKQTQPEGYDVYTIKTHDLDLDSALNIVQQIMDSALYSTLTSPSASHKKLPVPILTFKAHEFKVKNTTFSPFTAHFDLNRQNKIITIETMKQCHLNPSALITLKPDAIEFSFVFEEEDQDIEPVMTCFYEGEKLLQGKYSMTGVLTTSAPLFSHENSSSGTNLAVHGNMDSDQTTPTLHPDADLLKNNLKGSFEILSRNGRIFRLTLLSRVLSVINISRLMEGKFPDIEQTGFAYETVQIDGEVDQGRIILNKAVINGIDMTLLFSGWMDPFEKQMELTGLVAPFKTADKIIEKIPVIDKMLNGRLISIPVKAWGSIHDPQVMILHPSDVGKGLINTMQNLLTTPFKIMKTLPQTVP